MKTGNLLGWLMGLAVAVSGVVGVFAAENRPVGWEPVAVYGWEADSRHLVRFTTTTSAANTAVCVVSTHTAYSLTVSTTNGVTFSPVQTSSTTNTWGGRSYMTFQVVDTVAVTDHVNFDFRSVDLSTTTSPWLVEGQWLSPDDPVAWQGEVCFKSPSTFTVTGWYWMGRPR